MAQLELVRLLLALATSAGWDIHHMDVKLPFLDGKLEEEVYVQQPPSFAAAGKEQLAAVKRILSYIVRSAQHGCRYGRGSGAPRLVGYSDNDMGGDVNSC
jgi:hypothetical protein